MIPIETPTKFQRETETLHVHSLKRHAAGYWTAYILVRVRVHLPDGRAIYGSHILPLRCNQLGRKPNTGETRTRHLRERNGDIRPNSREGQGRRARGAEPEHRQRNTTKRRGVAHQ